MEEAACSHARNFAWQHPLVFELPPGADHIAFRVRCSDGASVGSASYPLESVFAQGKDEVLKLILGDYAEQDIGEVVCSLSFHFTRWVAGALISFSVVMEGQRHALCRCDDLVSWAAERLASSEETSARNTSMMRSSELALSRALRLRTTCSTCCPSTWLEICSLILNSYTGRRQQDYKLAVLQCKQPNSTHCTTSTRSTY